MKRRKFMQIMAGLVASLTSLSFLRKEEVSEISFASTCDDGTVAFVQGGETIYEGTYNQKDIESELEKALKGFEFDQTELRKEMSSIFGVPEDFLYGKPGVGRYRN